MTLEYACHPNPDPLVDENRPLLDIAVFYYLPHGLLNHRESPLAPDFRQLGLVEKSYLLLKALADDLLPLVDVDLSDPSFELLLDFLAFSDGLVAEVEITDLGCHQGFDSLDLVLRHCLEKALLDLLVDESSPFSEVEAFDLLLHQALYAAHTCLDIEAKLYLRLSEEYLPSLGFNSSLDFLHVFSY